MRNEVTNYISALLAGSLLLKYCDIKLAAIQGLSLQD